MRYSGELASIQQQLAACHDMDARRVAVLGALDAGPGDRVLEIGCGPGLCLAKIAAAVGDDGTAAGIDLSIEQVEAARSTCDGLSQVTVEQGDARDLALGDGELDATVSMQVLEYIDDVDVALAEIARVTRPGGRFVNVATNWDSLFWSGGDAVLTAEILAVWEEHCAHPNLPVDLPNRLRRFGFAGVTQHPVTIVNRRFHPDRFSWGAARLMVAFAEGLGAIDERAGDAWIASLEAADRAGTHFVSSVPVLTVATRAG